MQSGEEKTVTIDNLSIGYRVKGVEKVVAHGLRADINQGEMTCLLGANGVGKSTLLRTLAAFLPPLKGSVRVKGKNIDAYKSQELSRLIGVVLTERCRVRNLTSMELIAMGRSPYTGFWGVLDKTDRQVVVQAMEQTGIGHLAQRKVSALSDGELQKVMIAKALAQETPIVILDEPTAFLDYPSKIDLMQLLRHLAHSLGKTIFLSTHDIDLALQLADKLWLMSDNGGLTIGTPEDLAINGSLQHFFHHTDVIFQPSSGLFTLNPHCHASVCLEGEGLIYEMARKALNRMGIEVSKDAATYSSVYIRVENGVFVVCYGKKERILAKNVEELLIIVGDIFPDNNM